MYNGIKLKLEIETWIKKFDCTVIYFQNDSIGVIF